MYIFYAPNQELVFLYSLFVGVILGILYDIFRIKREFFGSNRALLFVDDVIYMLFCSIILILGILKVNSGKLRWYELLCPAAGFIVYRFTISKIVIKFFFFLSRTIKKCFLFCIHLLWKIIKPFFSVFGKIFTFAAVILYSFVLLYYRRRNLTEILKKAKVLC